MSNIVTPPSIQQAATDDQKIFTQPWFMFFQDIWRAIRRNLGIKLGGTINVDTSTKSNSDNSETDLITYDLIGNNLANNGDYLEIIAFGTFAANTNNKTLKLYFGDQIIYQTDANAANNGSWQFKTAIIRTGASTQEICTELLASNTTVQNDSNYPLVRVAGNQNLSSSLTIKCTGQGSATNDITQNALMIKLFPYS
jgi:hypothetical protein